MERGDSLWRIARSQLGDAGEAELQDYVDDLYAANRGTIGPDPNLIMPGQRLEMP